MLDSQGATVLLNPAQFRILLAGPRVSRLLPFFTARGYVAEAAIRGTEALALLQQAPRHVVLVELDLDDMLCGDLLIQARQKNLAGSMILLEDPSKTGLIVSTLVRGVDGYVATPPDEAYLFRVIERQLLAQWALAQGAQDARDAEEKQRLERQLLQERAKITELVKELGALRTEVSGLKKQFKQRLPNEPGLTKPAPTAAHAKNVNDERTAPRGYQVPSLPGLDDASADHTRVGDPRQKSQPPASGKGAPVKEDDDLFSVFDEPTGSVNAESGTPAFTEEDDFLKLDD
jgi:ActR/RegA family two-component response regulator